jgi:SAM-dependent methyltransferase
MVPQAIHDDTKGLTAGRASGKMGESFNNRSAASDSTHGNLTMDALQFAAAASLLSLLSSQTMTAKDLLKAVLPPQTRHWLRRQPLRAQLWFRRGSGLYRRTSPFSRNWGGGRGRIIDRYYIEDFLAEHSDDVHGHVLEFFDDAYTRQFGGDKVTKADLLHLTADNPHATIIADISDGNEIPSDTFDCIICTQVLLFVYDLRAAIRTLYRILKPGGVLLLTAPGIQKISRGDMDTSGEYWRFTVLSLRKLFEEVFPSDCMKVKASGNVLAATAFLYGLAVEDLRRRDLKCDDPDFPVSISLRAVKPVVLAKPAS